MKKIGDITLIHGDCLQVLPTLPDKSVDLVLTDLPYGCLNKCNKHAQWDKEIDLDALWDELLRVAKPNAAIVLFGRGMFSAKLMMSQPKLWRYNLVWKKGNRISCPMMAKKRFLPNHEDILVFYRKQPAYHPQMEKGKANHSMGNIQKYRNSTNNCYGDFKRVENNLNGLKYPKSVLVFDRDYKDFLHPTQKPVPLLEYLIRTYSNEGDCVLDCTMGSGSTMVACAKTNRKGIGIELMMEYYDIAVRRVEESKNKEENEKDRKCNSSFPESQGLRHHKI